MNPTPDPAVNDSPVSNPVPLPGPIKSKIKRLLPVIGLILILPVIAGAVKLRQLIAPQASLPTPILAVKVSPGQILTYPNAQPTFMSAEAYDYQGRAVASGASFTWGISSTNSIGNLKPDLNNTKLAAFYPSQNKGQGDIWVKAEYLGATAATSIPVYSGIVPPTPYPTCLPQPKCASGEPDASGRVVFCDPPPGVQWCPPATPTPTPTPSTSSCTGQPDGTKCQISNCPVCTPGQPCPLIYCKEEYGYCQKGRCVQSPTPTPSSPLPDLRINSIYKKVTSNVSDQQLIVEVCNDGIGFPDQFNVALEGTTGNWSFSTQGYSSNYCAPVSLSCAVMGKVCQTYSMLATADPENKIKESNESNNSLKVVLASPSPTPTPTPIVNANPKLLTKSLPTGIRWRVYHTVLTGIDPDPKDTLTMSLVKSPTGFLLGCFDNFSLATRKPTSQISCTLYGIPYWKGTKSLTVQLRDNRGGFTSTTYPLDIKK